MIDGWAWWTLMTLIKRQATPRPVTHVAWSTTIASLGGSLQDVIIDTGTVGTSWRDSWYDAALRIRKDGELSTDVNVRASDAYILALLNGVPIFVTERLLERSADTLQ